MKIEKGQPGYLRVQKTRYLLWAVVEFAVVAAVFILGYVQTGKKENLFTVVAIVGCLPAAKMLVEFIPMYPHQGIEPSKYREIEEKAPLVTRVYDLLITSTGKGMPVEAFVIYGHGAIKKTLLDQRYDKMTVKIFHDYSMFLARAEGLNNIAAVERQESDRNEQNIKRILTGISM